MQTVNENFWKQQEQFCDIEEEWQDLDSPVTPETVKKLHSEDLRQRANSSPFKDKGKIKREEMCTFLGQLEGSFSPKSLVKPDEKHSVEGLEGPPAFGPTTVDRTKSGRSSNMDIVRIRSSSVHCANATSAQRRSVCIPTDIKHLLHKVAAKKQETGKGKAFYSEKRMKFCATTKKYSYDESVKLGKNVSPSQKQAMAAFNLESSSMIEGSKSIPMLEDGYLLTMQDL